MAQVTNNVARDTFRRYRMRCAELRNAKRMAATHTAWASIAAEKVIALEKEIAEITFAYFSALAAEKVA